jgi:SulP family sulfate permease
VIVWIALRMVRVTDLREALRSDRGDLAVLGVTAALALFVDLYMAVFTGVALSLGLVVRRASLLRLLELRRAPAGHYAEHAIDAETGCSAVTLLQAEGDLFFAVADELGDRLHRVAERGTRGIVLRLKRTLAIDDAAAAALARFARTVAQSGGVLVLCGVRPELRASVERSELAAALGDENILQVEPGARPFASVERALDQVQLRLGLQRGPASLRAVPESESGECGWSI